MEIIKEGTVKPWIYVFECEICGCVFEMDYNNPDDARIMDKSIIAGIDFMKAPCPACHHRAIGYHEEEEDADS